MSIYIDIKKTKYDEYCVRFIEDGRRIEARCYYTHDLEDAKDTRELMLKEVEEGR